MALRRLFIVLILVALAGCSGQTRSGGSTSGRASTSSASTGSAGSSSGSSSTSSGSTGGSGSTGSLGSSGGSGSTSGGSTTGAQPHTQGCLTDVSAGHHQFDCDGSVTYEVEVPAACAAGGCGLVLDIHGYTMDADQEDLATGMRALAAQHRVVVIQPSAPGAVPSWSPSESFGPKVFAFAQDAASALVTDPHRAYVMGFSQGGAMTWWMVCNHSDFFAAAAPLAGGGVSGCTFQGSDVPTRAMPVLQVHGHHDNVVDFNLNAVPQRDAALAYWSAGSGTTLEQDDHHQATRYLTSAGTPYEFWEHDYEAGSVVLGGHCVPGGSDVGPYPFQYGCQDAPTFHFGELAATFFDANPRP